MSTTVGKRKRKDVSVNHKPVKKPALSPAAAEPTQEHHDPSNPQHLLHVQIVTGSYERVLHGISAAIPHSRLRTPAAEENVTFSDSFLFEAHTSAIRCLAISSSETADKCLLATGSADERINVYSLSTTPPLPNSNSHLPSLSGTAVAENSRNRSLGSLIHHDRAITRLQFPSKSKLFSAAEDSTISISRTRDWTVLSSIKAPIPKPQGRPSGDTAAPGEIPAGINDFAIHPSQKLMLSVGRGERCMRLWNLMTGKKAGVLNFERDVLAQVGEGKHSSGEGRRVLWDEAGENFVVGFERGAAVFGIDSQPLAIIKPDRPTKIHQMRFLPWAGAPLAFSTEDGRILFYDISSAGESSEAGKLPLLECLGQLGGPTAGIEGRIKDFEVLKLSGGEGLPLLFITASSDGAVRLWSASPEDFITKAHAQNGAAEALKQIGTLIATHETGERITCLGVFILDGKPSDGVEEATEDLAGAELAGEDSEDVESD